MTTPLQAAGYFRIKLIIFDFSNFDIKFFIKITKKHI